MPGNNLNPPNGKKAPVVSDLMFDMSRYDKEIFNNLSNYPQKKESHTEEEFLNVNCKTLELFVDIERSENPSINLVVKNIIDLERYVKELNETGRYQIIVQNGAHFTTCDVKVNENGTKSAIVLDAAGDLRLSRAMLKLMHAGCTPVIIPGEDEQSIISCLQHDTFSCPNFALDHAIQVAAIDNIHETLGSLSDEICRVVDDDRDLLSPGWVQLPPQLIHNIQSMAELQNYKKNHPVPEASDPEKYFSKLDAYVEKGTTETAGKKRNESTTINVRDLFVDKANQLMERHHDRTQRQILLKQQVSQLKSPAIVKASEQDEKDNKASNDSPTNKF